MNRRNMLSIVGGGTILAASGGGLFLGTRTPHDAIKPWATAAARHYSDPRKRALSYAILAPNPHNRQPWIVELIGEHEVALYFDSSRTLPQTDPFDRQLTIGLGAFLELLAMAAEADGFAVQIALFPDGDMLPKLAAKPVARCVFSKQGKVEPDPLWPFVLHRRSTKEPYDIAKPVAPGMLREITGVARHGCMLAGSVDPADVARWRDITSKALQIETATARTFKESVDLFRIGKAEINANPDGIDFPGPLFETLALFGMMSREAALDPQSTAFQQGMAAVRENAMTAMGHVWLLTKANTRRDQIMAGRDWVRCNLAATRAGIAMQPMSQALQEFPEMAELHQLVHAKLAPSGETVQMLARIGYGPAVDASPRWPLDARMRARPGDGPTQG